MDHELEINEEMRMADQAETPDPRPTMIYCESCNAEYGVSHIVDAPGTPEHGHHF